MDSLFNENVNVGALLILYSRFKNEQIKRKSFQNKDNFDSGKHMFNVNYKNSVLINNHNNTFVNLFLKLVRVCLDSLYSHRNSIPNFRFRWKETGHSV